MTEIKEEDIEIKVQREPVSTYDIDSDRASYYLEINPPFETELEAKEYKQQILEWKQKAEMLDGIQKLLDFKPWQFAYNNVNAMAKRIIELQQQVKQLQEELDHLRQSCDNYTKEVFNQHQVIEYQKSQLEKYQKMIDDIRPSQNAVGNNWKSMTVKEILEKALPSELLISEINPKIDFEEEETLSKLDEGK